MELSAGFFVILDISNRGIHWDCYPLVFTTGIKCQKYNFKSTKLGDIACHIKIGNACQSIGDTLVQSYCATLYPNISATIYDFCYQHRFRSCRKVVSTFKQ